MVLLVCVGELDATHQDGISALTRRPCAMHRRCFPGGTRCSFREPNGATDMITDTQHDDPLACSDALVNELLWTIGPGVLAKASNHIPVGTKGGSGELWWFTNLQACFSPPFTYITANMHGVAPQLW